MKEINNELTKQQLYYEINELVRPLLPEYEAIEKRGESKNNVVDYSVCLIRPRSITTSSWPTPSSTASLTTLQTR
jgi:hypothetical protein